MEHNVLNFATLKFKHLVVPYISSVDLEECAELGHKVDNCFDIVRPWGDRFPE